MKLKKWAESWVKSHMIERVPVKLIGGIINNNKFLCSLFVIDIACASECKNRISILPLGFYLCAIRPPSAPILNLGELHVFGANFSFVINDRWHLFGSLITQQLHLIPIIMISLYPRCERSLITIIWRTQSHILKGDFASQWCPCI
jgi:hypothetical protein